MATVERKPFTVICSCKDGTSLEIDNVKASATTASQTFEICTDDETYIFPLSNLIYARLIKKGADDEIGGGYKE